MALAVVVLLDYFWHHLGRGLDEVDKLFIPVADLQGCVFVFEDGQQRGEGQVYGRVEYDDICLVQEGELILCFSNQMIVRYLDAPLFQPIEGYFDIQIEADADHNLDFSLDHLLQQAIDFLCRIFLCCIHFLLLSEDIAHGLDDVDGVLAVFCEFGCDEDGGAAEEGTVEVVVGDYFGVCVEDEEGCVAKVDSGGEAVADASDEFTHLVAHGVEGVVFELGGEQFHFLQLTQFAQLQPISQIVAILYPKQRSLSNELLILIDVR